MPSQKIRKKKKHDYPFSLSNSLNVKIPLQYRETHANRKGANCKAGGGHFPCLGPLPSEDQSPSPVSPSNHTSEKSTAAHLLLMNFKSVAVLHFKL